MKEACKRCKGEKENSEKKFCETCLEKTRRWRKACHDKKRREGRCFACGKKTSTGTRCKECHKKNMTEIKARRKRWLGEGRCRDCGTEAQMIDRVGQHHMPGGKRSSNYCRDCFLKMIARYVLGSGKRWLELIKILDRQNWRCAYTGEQLVLGENLSFDHCDPICRFPLKKGDVDNLEAVTLTVNLMKRHMTKEEFLTLVKIIAARN